ncbi:hypothetical protein J3E68DRAFT_413828 [Trichoderma sp. SZMC 28012]
MRVRAAMFCRTTACVALVSRGTGRFLDDSRCLTRRWVDGPRFLAGGKLSGLCYYATISCCIAGSRTMDWMTDITWPRSSCVIHCSFRGIAVMGGGHPALRDALLRPRKRQWKSPVENRMLTGFN